MKLPAFVSLPLNSADEIALKLGKDIMAGRYVEGEHLVEANIARYFEVSCGTVRNAFRILERRRAITFGLKDEAVVRPISVNLIAEIFNVRTALFSTAAGLMAQIRPPVAMVMLANGVQRVQSLADNLNEPLHKYLTAIVEIASAVVRGSNNTLIAEILRSLDQQAVWADLWKKPHYFRALEVRHRQARNATKVGEAIKCGDPVMAERAMRQLTEYNRDQVIQTLVETRCEQVNPIFMIKT